MTIIEPNKNKKRVNIFFWVSIGLLLSVALLSISVYNQTVNQNHKIASLEEKIMSFETENAELKNDRYSLMDVKNLHQAASAAGLVKLVHPEYLEVSPSPFLANR